MLGFCSLLGQRLLCLGNDFCVRSKEVGFGDRCRADRPRPAAVSVLGVGVRIARKPDLIVGERRGILRLRRGRLHQLFDFDSELPGLGFAGKEETRNSAATLEC